MNITLILFSFVCHIVYIGLAVIKISIIFGESSTSLWVDPLHRESQIPQRYANWLLKVHGNGVRGSVAPDG